ncbi:MFS transporter [Bradyrhizobium erythrophlei]|uniref:MFS transporter n=1 Tax=Bradyrhizobium erythrophlei TaxID=1437360 RepID=UPI001FD95606
MPQLVPKQELTAAAASNGVGVDISGAIGPALGRVVIGGMGIAAPFWIDAFGTAAKPKVTHFTPPAWQCIRLNERPGELTGRKVSLSGWRMSYSDDVGCWIRHCHRRLNDGNLTRSRCSTVVLHRHFPPVREKPVFDEFCAVQNRWRREIASGPRATYRAG